MTDPELAKVIRKAVLDRPLDHPAQKALQDAHSALMGEPKVVQFQRHTNNTPPTAA